MEVRNITKVVISESDIISALEALLEDKGLKPLKPINITINSRYVGYGMGEHQINYIGDTLIECEQINKTNG